MHSYYNEPKRGDCPSCGAKEGATMCSTVWGHNFSCCGDSCGMDLKEKIDANTSSEEFHAALVDLEEAKMKVREIKYQGLPIDSDPFEFMNGQI